MATTEFKRWDNPVPMLCEYERASRFASWHIVCCGHPASFIKLDGETVAGFLCTSHAQEASGSYNPTSAPHDQVSQ
jgi:hypothetical protein